MAKQLVFTLASIFVFAMGCGAILVEAFSPWEGEPIPPEPIKGIYTFVGRCKRNLTDDCGATMFNYTFYRTTDIPRPSCYKLLMNGKLGNVAMSYTLVSGSRYKPWRGHIYEKSMEAFSFCANKLGIDGNGARA